MLATPLRDGMNLVAKDFVASRIDYRQADPEFGERQAHELRVLLGDVLSNQPLEAVRTATSAAESIFLHVAIGDDRSDEDLFRALPEHAMTGGVGCGAPPAAFHVPGTGDVRALLCSITLTRRIRNAPCESVTG